MNPHNSKYGLLITGAAGGLGSQLVRLAEDLPGIDVIVATDIDTTISERYTGNKKVLGIPMDVRSESSILELKQHLVKLGIRIKYLVNNAGTHAFFPLSESTEALLDKIMRVNVYGPVLTVSAFLDDLITTQGRVVQVSSDSVHLPTPFYAYPASKISLEAFSVSMRRELTMHGIKLVLLRPGAMETPFLEEMSNITNEIPDSRYKKWFDRFARLAAKDIGKRSDPTEVAALIMDVLKKKKPRLAYSINKNRKVAFFRLFPERLQDTLMAWSVAG